MALSPKQINLIETSFEAVKPAAEKLVDTFYKNLFATAPQVREMFPADLKDQKQKLLASIALVVQNIRKPEVLRPALEQMGARHTDYGDQEAHYPVVRDVMIQTLSEIAGELWNDDLNDAWTTALNHIAGTMITGARGTQRLAA
ncbi:MAG: globin domain-containing protein [Planctomycetota bacterium]|jgi:nitric oxide dioxygenase